MKLAAGCRAIIDELHACMPDCQDSSHGLATTAKVQVALDCYESDVL